MATLREFTAAIKARIDEIQGLDGVVVLIEDAADLDNRINRALDEQGMLILIGQPIFRNTGDSNHVGNMTVSSAIAVGESPLQWRDEPLTKPVCLDVVQAVIESLQGFTVPGFQPLRVSRADFVPDKKRQLYEITVESETVIQRTQ